VSTLPDEVATFIRERIETFEQLETLLLLQAQPDRAWTNELVSSELNIAPRLASDALDHLCRCNLLDVRVGEEKVTFRYAPGTTELDRAVKELVRSHRENRIELMRVLSANAVQRLRTSAIQMFADAFLVGRKKND
jgi:hypothetical protein